MATEEIYIYGSVDDDMVVELFALRKALLREPQKRVHLWLNTEGGTDYDGLAAYDILRPFYERLTITVVGMCHSAGIAVLLAAKEREATPNSSFLIHMGEGTHSGGKQMVHNFNLAKLYEDIMVHELGISYTTARKWQMQETYMDAKKAKMAGLIQTIRKL